MSGAVVTVRGPSGELCVDLIEAARNMSAAEQQKLFRHIGRNITAQDCQSAMTPWRRESWRAAKERRKKSLTANGWCSRRSRQKCCAAS